MAIRILLVDDHAVLREGLKALLNHKADLNVIGEAHNGREAILAVDKLKPDIMVTDISMPGLNGIEGVRVVRQSYPQVKIIVLSMHANKEYVTQALQAGANGYIIKQSDTGEVVAAIRAVSAGGAYLSPRVSKYLIEDYLNQPSNDVPNLPDLTTREREVVQLIAEGLTTRDIAATLHISVKTVETHRVNIMKKLNTKSQADIVKYAIKKGLVQLD